jgi:hypothetical protein
MEEETPSYEQFIEYAVQIVSNIFMALKEDKPVNCDAPIEAMNIFTQLNAEEPELIGDKRVISSISMLMSSSTLDIAPYVNNVEFITSLMQLLPKHFSELAVIIESCINCNYSIIPWLVSSESNFNSFPENDEFLRLFVKIHRIIKQCGEELDTTVINEKAMNTIASSSVLEPINVLNAVASLINCKFIPLSPEIIQIIHNLIQIIATDEAFDTMKTLEIKVEEDLPFIHECLTKHKTIVPCIRYLRQTQATKLTSEIINIIITLFDLVPFKSKIDIFYIIEPFATVLHDPRVIKISSFFIDDCPIGSLAIKTTYLAFITLNEEDLDFCMEYISEKYEELEEIVSSNDSVDSIFASLFLDELRS